MFCRMGSARKGAAAACDQGCSAATQIEANAKTDVQDADLMHAIAAIPDALNMHGRKQLP